MSEFQAGDLVRLTDEGNDDLINNSTYGFRLDTAYRVREVDGSYLNLDDPNDELIDSCGWSATRFEKVEENRIDFTMIRADTITAHTMYLNQPDEKPDMVDHPAHYNLHPKGIEAIDYIEDNPFPNLANAQRYLHRVSWGGKWDDLEDLRKAAWYINREISRREKRGEAA